MLPFLYILLLPKLPSVDLAECPSHCHGAPHSTASGEAVYALNQGSLYGAIFPAPGFTLAIKGWKWEVTHRYYSYWPPSKIFASFPKILCSAGLVVLVAGRDSFTERHNHDSSEREIKTASQVSIPWVLTPLNQQAKRELLCRLQWLALTTKGKLDCRLTRQPRKSVCGRQGTPWSFSWYCHIYDAKLQSPSPGRTPNSPDPLGKKF